MRSLGGSDDAAQPMGRLILRAQIAARRAGAWVSNLETRSLPRFSRIAFAFLGATALYGTALGGHGGAVLEAVSAPLGFTIDRVDIAGNAETSQIDILQTVYMTGAQTLPGLDVTAAREALEAMPWIESATIRKIYPDRLQVDVVERVPYAIWQRGRDLMVIDRDGNPIVPFSTTRFTDLPFVVGIGAETAAAELIDRIEIIPELTPRVHAFIRVGDRRWDLRLDNGVTVRLPELEPVQAAAEVVRLDREAGLLSRDIVSVDMRIDDRMVVKLSPAAQERRDAALKERDKLVRKAQRDNPA